MPIGIIAALAGLQVEVAADHICKFDYLGFGDTQLDKAAFCTAVTQGFPFFMAHLFKGFFFPEWFHC
jgi:hypothetical protein